MSLLQRKVDGLEQSMKDSGHHKTELESSLNKVRRAIAWCALAADRGGGGILSARAGLALAC